MLLAKDIAHGFPMVVPTDLVPLITGAMVQPTGMAEQWVLDNNGKRKVKCRITQDHLRKQSNRHESLPRDDLWLVPSQNYPLHSGPAISLARQIDPCHQVRLQRCMPSDCPQRQGSGLDDDHARSTRIRLLASDL
jgi:hypothetical protein